jgi:hypothetical protein
VGGATMSPSMRPVIMPGIRERLPLPLVTLAICSIMRVFLGDSENWFGGDHQSAIAIVVYGALIPMFTVAMASGWLRGDATPWAWALARPVSRVRWLGTTLLIDIATLIVCVASASCVLGTLPIQWFASFPGAGIRETSYALVLALVYAASAFAGARGASAVGAAMYVAALSAAFIAVMTVANLVEIMFDSAVRGYGRSVVDALERAFPLSSRTLVYQELSATIVLPIMSAFAVFALLRTAARCPGRPSFRVVLAPLLWTVLLACAAEVVLVMTVFVVAET